MLENLSQTTLPGSNISHVHLLFQSFGGFIGDAFCLHTFFSSFPLALTIYNVGSIESAGVIAYLGGKRRLTSPHATFMIHKSISSAQPATAYRLQSIAEAVALEDKRIEALLHDRLIVSDESWDAYNYNCDIIFAAEEAVKAGLAHAIGEFTPPPGTPIYSL